MLADFLDATADIYDRFARAADDTAQGGRLKKARLDRSTAQSCGHCGGKGEWTTDLDYLGSFIDACPYCRGSGLATELAMLRLRGRSLAQFLIDDIDALGSDMVADCGLDKAAAGLQEFALGHLSLGRRLHSLSGGELQRLRLARLFMKLPDAPSLLLLDEPDSGLGFDECRQLLASIKKRLRLGHAAIVISHHPLMMCQADHLIDLGPGAGEAGGKLTASGTPHELLSGNWPLSKTAVYLKQLSNLKTD